MIAVGGTSSDEAPEILATGRSGIGSVFVSMATRHPAGDDAGYLEWHTLDHRPEQFRLAGLRAAIRLVSTPACRAARGGCLPRLDAIDHVMSYFFASDDALAGFADLSQALRDAGRSPFILPPVYRRALDVGAVAAAPHIKAGADVLPWRPAKGVYLLLTDHALPLDELIAVPGVGGAWSAGASGAAAGAEALVGFDRHELTYLFLDEEPPVVADRIRTALEPIQRERSVRLAFAAPFHLVIPFEWDRYLP